MSEELPPALRRMIDDLPVGQPPLGALLAERRQQRGRRRWAILGTAAATIAVITGGLAATQMAGGGHHREAEAPGSIADSSGSDATSPQTSVSRPGELKGSVIDLPTSSWREGDSGMDALIHGTLSTDRRGCVVLRHGGGGTTAVIWPADHSAVVDVDGRLHLLDATGTAVARDGDEVSMGGGYVPAGDNRHPCVRGKKEVAWVQDTVTVTEPGDDYELPDLSEPTGSPDDRAYAKWLEREALPDCGTQWFGGFSLPTDRLNYVICLRAAAEAGTGGEAVVHYTSVEGDPITQYLRALPDGSAELFEDATQDTFGSGRWHRWTCGDVDRLLEHRC